MTNQIIGLGGGGFTMEQNPLLDLYILGASPKKNPTICLLPTASGDNWGYIQYFMETFGEYPCNPRYLQLLSPTISNREEFLLESDIIYVGGGNTKSMLGLWKEWGVDQILKKAYDRGTILAGVSAGFVCWFEECVTDSEPKQLTSMPCLGLLKGSGCPHYNGDSKRRPAFHGLLKRNKIKPGYAADDGVGLHFVNGELIRAISNQEQIAGYRVYKNVNNEVIEDTIVPENLANDEICDKYIKHLFLSEAEPEIELQLDN